jgi:hypothetical protein
MNEKILDTLWEDANALDDAVVKLGDALDVKASIVLVLATFLGAVSGPILILHDLAAWVKFAQATAVAALGCAVVACLIALWPAEFILPPTVEAWEAFITEAADEQKDNPNGLDAVLLDLYRSRLRKAKERIGINRRFTDRKSKYNSYAFYAVAIAILMDGATLVWLAHTHL